ncbi:MAG: MBL fold metallo-hydrolase [Oxalobacter sp.]|nr:MBL fold metallo-hydrolase [Oxalobacter sp.]
MVFTNLKSGFRKPAGSDTLKWMMGWHNERRPKSPSTGVPIPFETNDGQLIASGSADTLTWIGQASFLIQLDGRNCLIDPVMSESLGFIKRNSPPGLTWTVMPRIDVVFITHNHRDHMDAATLKRLGDAPVYVVPQGLGKWFHTNGMNKVIEMGWWQEEQVEGIDVTFVPAEHWSRRGLADINTSWWGGYVISRHGKTLYHSGDSGWFDGFAQIAEKFKGKIDVAMLPTGAYAPRWFMSPQHIDPAEAVKYFQMLEARHFVAMHWGTFKLSDEPLDEPLHLLPKLWEQAGLAPEQLTCGILGKTWLLDEWLK